MRNAALLAAGCMGFSALIGALFLFARPESSPALRGRKVAERTGCFACHGPEGAVGLPNPGSAAGRVPSWDAGTMAQYVKREEEFFEWVLLGETRDSAGKGETVGTSLVPMPAYEGILSEKQTGDLVAYLKAVSGWDPAMGDSAYEGRKAALRLGCFGCHGPSGMGGVPNPGSLSGFVSGWTGRRYDRLVRDDSELREWILDGRGARAASNRVIRFFLDRQKIKMPAYRSFLRDDELDNLAAYIKHVRASAR